MTKVSTQKKPESQAAPSRYSDEHIAAINQSFSVFKRNYHNQFFKAFADEKELSIGKKLWADSLTRFAPEVIVKATRRLIEQEAFLPTLKTMIDHCEAVATPGLGDCHAAYLEACNAPSPKSAFSWSHPIVYHAGLKTGWYLLASGAEYQAYPIFKENYHALLSEVRSGKTLTAPSLPAIENQHASTKSAVNAQESKRLSQAFVESLKE